MRSPARLATAAGSATLLVLALGGVVPAQAAPPSDPPAPPTQDALTTVLTSGPDAASPVQGANASDVWHWLAVADWLGVTSPWQGGGAADPGAAQAAADEARRLLTSAEGKYANPKALAAVEFALGKVGLPYKWGATGPSSYDCSGLMLRAYGSVGVKLPRVSRQQYFAGQRVALDALVPGDLLFWARNTSLPETVHHVGMYVGEGRVLHAPYTGAKVRVNRVWRHGLIGAVRMLPATGTPPSKPPPTPSVTPSPTPSPTPTPTPTPSPTPTPTPTPTPSPTLTTPSPTPSPSATTWEIPATSVLLPPYPPVVRGW